MKEIPTSLTEVMNKIIDNDALAVTANNQLAKEGLILLTVYPENEHTVDDYLTEINTSLIEGFPAQIEFKPSWFGIPTYQSTLVYLREDRSAVLGKGSEISRKSLQEGLEDLQSQQTQTVFDNTGVNEGGRLLREYAEKHQPDVAFASKYTDTVIEVYKVSRHEYAFGFHRSVYADYISGGRIQLEYGCSRVEEVSSEELRDSDCYQRNLPLTGQTLPPA
jgi:hypothetical protein